MADGELGQRKVYKDSAVRAMDEFLGGTGGVPLSQALQYARGLLADTSQSLAELTEQAVRQQRGVSVDQEQAQHFATHWGEEAQNEMRRGYTAAIDLASEDELLPIETFWVTGPNERFRDVESGCAAKPGRAVFYAFKMDHRSNALLEADGRRWIPRIYKFGNEFGHWFIANWRLPIAD